MLRRLSIHSPDRPSSVSPRLFSRVKPADINIEILDCIPVGIVVLENAEIIGCNVTFTKFSGYTSNTIQDMTVGDLVPKYAVHEIHAKNIRDLMKVTNAITRRENVSVHQFNVYTSKEQVSKTDIIVKHEGRFCIITFTHFNDLFTPSTIS